MTSDLRQQLQSALSGSYALERELGGGGMSRVFVAQETRLGRTVVVKVLHPDLTAGVNVERFRREIALAAALQHPCIVPLLNAGEVDGLPYYTMPFVESESLRAHLAAHGALSLNEAVKVMRDVASALAYAHEHAVVHRDIKPDNVLLSGGYAVVTDFGIAKALSAAKVVAPGGTITQLGTSVGTPAYMAPEQAAGDANVDHRADIYSFGCMAYELLSGKTPFHGRSAAKLLVAQMGETPVWIAQLRPELPPTLAQLVMQCLEKDEARRPQNASEILQVLDAIGTPSGGAHEVGPAIRRSTRRSLVRALGMWAAAFVAVVIVTKAAIIAIGLPSWTFMGSVVVMALGLPVILFTSFAQHGATVARTMAMVTPGGSLTTQSKLTKLAVKASPFLSWRRTAMGGALAVGAFVLLVAGYMVLRLLGIGPAGSLFGKGVLHEQDKVVLADLQSRDADSTLGLAFTEALRTDLSQSRAVQLVQPSVVQGTLERMSRPANAHLDATLAREVAQREGATAVIDGDVTRVGSGYLLTLRLINPTSGDALASLRETADNSGDVISAMGKLSHELRAKVGESLRTLQGAPQLERVSTVSLEALRKYTQGIRAFDMDRDFPRSIDLLRAAIALDTNFAMAYRKLNAAYNRVGGHDAEAAAAIKRAFELRERLPPLERHLTAGSYYDFVDLSTAIAEYEAALAIDPDNGIALFNVGRLFTFRRDHARARELYAHLVAVDSNEPEAPGMLAEEQFFLGDTVGAVETFRTLERHRPNAREVFNGRTALLIALEHYDSAEAQVRLLASIASKDKIAGIWAAYSEASLALLRGRFQESLARSRVAWAREADFGNSLIEYDAVVNEAGARAWFFGRNDEAIRLMDALSKRYDSANVPAVSRGHLRRAWVYALAGRPDRARALIADFVATVPREQRGRPDDTLNTRGWIALAEGHPDAAIQFFRADNAAGCELCSLTDLGRAYDLAGKADSAIAVFERALGVNDMYRSLHGDASWLPATYKRLGELYDARGDTEKALYYYGKFVTLWAKADPELQPQVVRARKRMTELAARKG